MDKDLKSYIKIYNIVEPEVCDLSIKELQFCNWHQHEYYNSKTETRSPLNGSKELDVTSDLISTSKYIESKVWEAFKNYVTQFNFPWFQGWKSFTDVRFNRYKENNIMSVHCDHIHSIFDGERKGIPIMTALGMLNDDYEGGELVIFEESILCMKKGDIAIFPSCFLFPHRVTPVISGIRYSYVCWAW